MGAGRKFTVLCLLLVVVCAMVLQRSIDEQMQASRQHLACEKDTVVAFVGGIVVCV